MTKSAGMNPAFTLVELLIVVSVVLISVGVAGDLIVSIVRSYNKTKAFNEIEQNGNYVLAKMSYDIRNARAITTCNSSQLSLMDASGSTITYSITGSGPVRITRNGSPITNEDSTNGVAVDSGSQFECNVSSPAWVRITLNLKQAKTGVSSTSSYSASNSFNVVVPVLGVQ